MFEFQFKQEKNLSAGISDKLIKQRSPPTSPASRWCFHSGKPPPPSTFGGLLGETEDGSWAYFHTCVEVGAGRRGDRKLKRRD